MTVTLNQLYVWMSQKEGNHLEFKEAKSGYGTEQIAKYCRRFFSAGFSSQRKEHSFFLTRTKESLKTSG